jgi:hypothetical protein
MVSGLDACDSPAMRNPCSVTAELPSAADAVSVFLQGAVVLSVRVAFPSFQTLNLYSIP